MKRIPASQQIRQEISRNVNILTELVKKGVQQLLQEAFEQEVMDHLGRGLRNF